MHGGIVLHGGKGSWSVPSSTSVGFPVEQVLVLQTTERSTSSIPGVLVMEEEFIVECMD